jgi:glycerol-3-phosphate cytidylyltransferase-like family protein
MNEFERCEILSHCKWVDEVMCPCPWVLTVDFLRKNNLHYVAHDEAPYGGEGQGDIYSEVKKLVSRLFRIINARRACLRQLRGQMGYQQAT